MNIFTKIDRFFHPSKYKDDRITKPLALVKERDYVFVLVLMRNPFYFKLDRETLYYLSDIPEGGTFSIQIGDNKIVSTSKQDIARFWKRKLFSNFPLSHFAYNNNDFISRQSQYKQCLAMLKKLL